MVLTSYFPNVYDRSKMICVEFVVNHSLEVENWDSTNYANLGKNRVYKDNYGLKPNAEPKPATA